MEEVSFRSGVIAAGGVLTAAGVTIALALTLSGPAATSAAVPSAGVGSAKPSSPVPVALAPSSGASPSARPSAHRTFPVQSYQAPPQEAAVTTPESPWADADLPNPRRARPRLGGPDASGWVNQLDSPGSRNCPWGRHFGTSGHRRAHRDATLVIQRDGEPLLATGPDTARSVLTLDLACHQGGVAHHSLDTIEHGTTLLRAIQGIQRPT